MAVPRYQSTDSSPLLSAGFRPFFLAAGLWAAMSMVVWVLMLRGFVDLPTTFGPFLGVFVAVVRREVVAGRSWRNLPALLVVANASSSVVRSCSLMDRNLVRE